MVGMSSVSTRSSSPTVRRSEETVVRKPAAEKTKPVAGRTATGAPTTTAAPTATPVAAPTARPTRETSLDTRRAVLGSASAAHLRAQLDTRLPGSARDVTGARPLGVAPTGDGSTRGGRRVSVDDPLAARIAADNPRDPLRPLHPSMRRGVGGAVAELGAELAGRGLPKAKPEGFSENADGSHTFTGSRGDDRYTVAQASDGSMMVTNDDTGAVYMLTADEAAHGVTVQAGAGDDRVVVDASVTTPLHIKGGTGDDRINARAAAGDVQLEGGSGDDRLLGGAGGDAISGGSGDDYIDGGAGNDQLLGQDGDDRLLGQEGEDFIQGGDGADRAAGGKGADAIYADRHDTRIDAGKDDDVDLIVAEQGSIDPTRVSAGDQVHEYDPEEVDAWLEANPEIAIEGSDDFEARTRADLGVMLTTEQGRGLLNDLAGALEADGETLTLAEKPLEDGAGGTHSSSDERIEVGQWSEIYPDGTHRMPLPVLFHELVHAYQNHVSGYPEGSSVHENGREVDNDELQATGLPWYDASGKLHPANELPYTDNQFREELGLPPRTRYGAGEGAPTGYAP